MVSVVSRPVGVSPEKVTLNPSGGSVGSGLNRLSRRSFVFAKQKVVTYPMENIAACVLRNEQNDSGM